MTYIQFFKGKNKSGKVKMNECHYCKIHEEFITVPNECHYCKIHEEFITVPNVLLIYRMISFS